MFDFLLVFFFKRKIYISQNMINIWQKFSIYQVQTYDKYLAILKKQYLKTNFTLKKLLGNLLNIWSKLKIIITII